MRYYKMQYLSHYHSPLGAITLASDGEHLIGLWFDGQEHFASTITEAKEEHNLAIFHETQRWLDQYFAGQRPDFIPKLEVLGTEFRKLVCDIMLAIPYGSTTTYKDIVQQAAAKLGRNSMSAQAVGGAVGHNPISIIIPCHRVIGTNGSLTGYAGGLDRKVQLLQLERNNILIH